MLMNICGARLSANEIPCVIASAIFMVAGQDFITWLELERLRNDIDSMCCIGDINQVVRIGVQVIAQGNARCMQESRQFPS